MHDDSSLDRNNTERRIPRFVLVLAAALVFLVLTPFLGVSPIGILGGKLIVTALLVVAVAELGPSHIRIALVLAAVAIGADWMTMLSGAAGLSLAAIGVRAAFFLYVAAVIILSVLRQGRVTIDTIAGAACAYLFIGFTWAMLYALLDYLEPGSILFPRAWTQDASPLTARYVYFSFVTLTTLGYGDIVPQTIDASGLVVAEAVIGQLYLAVLVARLVGLHLFAQGAAND